MSDDPEAGQRFRYSVDSNETVHRVADEAGPMSTGVALVVTLVFILVVNVGRTYAVPKALHDPFNICIGIVAAVIAWQAAMTFGELGLARRHLRRGAAWGGAAFAIQLVVLWLASEWSGRVQDQMNTSDAMDISAVDMWWTVLFIIPVATVLMEELLFRGVLLGLFRRVISTRMAVLASAFVFGLWHLVPAWDGGGAPGVGGGGGDLATVAITFAATFGLGIILGILRRCSGSLLAPIGCHVGINSVVFALTWHVVNG